MKMGKRCLALCAALLLLLSACALAEDVDPLLAKVGEREILQSEVTEMAGLLYQNGYTENEADYQAAMDYLVQQTVIERHISQVGYDQFTDEEMAAFQNEAAAQWDAAIEQYVAYYLTEDTQQARDDMRQQAEAFYMTNYGITKELLMEDLVMQAAYARLEDALVGDYAPTREEVDQVFAEYGAQYQAMYEGNVPMYEYYTQYQGSESWYVPEGYRAVIHILLSVDEAALSAYADAQGAYDEAASVEAPDEAAVAAAKQAMDDARAAVLAARQADIDAIYARLEGGESFQTLIAEYGEDPGMQDAATLAEGYRVHAESIMWDMAFTEGAFQPRMQAVGDWSDPVVGSYGIHILYYLSDVAGGLHMTQAIEDEIREYLVYVNTNNVYTAAIDQWKQETAITINQEALDALIAQAAAQAETDGAQDGAQDGGAESGDAGE